MVRKLPYFENRGDFFSLWNNNQSASRANVTATDKDSSASVDWLFVDHVLCTLMCCTNGQMGNLVPFCDAPLFLGMNPTDPQHNNLVNNIMLKDWAALQKLAHMQRWQTTTYFLSFTEDKWDANPNYQVNAHYVTLLALLDMDKCVSLNNNRQIQHHCPSNTMALEVLLVTATAPTPN